MNQALLELDPTLPSMARTKSAREAARSETFGDRLKRFRLAKGLTQTELGDRVGVSQRVITYYEVEGSSPAPELLIKFADALGVSTDELLGRKRGSSHARERERATRHMRLLRQFKRLEELHPNDRKTVLKMIDAFAIRSE